MYASSTWKRQGMCL